MFEHINTQSSVAVYLQIENLVQFAIASGTLKPGDQLPSILEVSKQVGVNPNTVFKSYRDLEVMGLIYTRRGMGAFINKGIQATCKEECRKRTIARLHEAVSEAKAAGMTAPEIKTLTEQSNATKSDPYGPTPEQLLALAKEKRATK